MSNVVINLPFDQVVARLPKERLFVAEGEAILFRELRGATIPLRFVSLPLGQTKLAPDRIWERGEDEETQLTLIAQAEEIGAAYQPNKVKQRLLNRPKRIEYKPVFSSMRQVLASGGLCSLMEQGEGALEIGCGNGLFLSDLLKRGRQAMGLEISNRCLRKAAFRLSESGFAPTSRFLVKADGLAFLRWMVPNRFLKKVFLLFPDPWDGALHRRIVTPHFLELVRERLVEGGIFFAATDHGGYAQQMRRLIGETPGIRLTNWEQNLETKYHQKWKKEGREIHRLAFVVEKHLDSINTESIYLDLDLKISGVRSFCFPRVILLSGGYRLILENGYRGEEGELVRTVLNPPIGMAQKQFLLLNEGSVSLVPTWHEVVMPPLLRALSEQAQTTP